MTDHTRTNPRTDDPTPQVLDHLDLQIAAGSDEAVLLACLLHNKPQTDFCWLVHPEGACDR